VQKNPTGSGFIHPEGHPGGFRIPNHEVLFTQWDKVKEKLGPGPWVNLFATVAHHLLEDGKGYQKPQRTGQTFQYQSVLAFDIDNIDTARGQDYLVCVARILRVEVQDLTLVCSGNGLQIYAHLRTPIRSAKYLQELKPAYNEICELISREIERSGLPFDQKAGAKVDPVIFDAGRILRVPGTLNQKPGKEDRPCTLIQYSPIQHELDLMVISGLDRMVKENVSPEQIRRQYPKPDFPEIVKECRFIDWALTNTHQVHEPQAFAMIGLMAAQDQNSKLDFNGGVYSPRELAQWVFDNATASASCKSQNFDRKWEDASRYGAQKCSTISGHWVGGCEQCPHNSKIPTPLALKSPDFVGSEEVGFWERNEKGKLTNPHYGDLVRVYSKAHSFVVTSTERVFTFQENRYMETAPIHVKAWVQRKMNPPDPMREHHRVEFLKNVLISNAIDPEKEDALFNKSIEGKVNLKNGVLDVKAGGLIPHDPRWGFQYVLPYDYIPDSASDFFLDWLDTITQSRPELMEAILDMMAYCLWPTYDDHAFFCLVGTGANGKSTLINIITAMIGKENCSAMSMQQLGQNRFAPANLEGMLANLSEESSGYELNYEELNVIQNLSAGGKMEVERKGSQGFSFKNKAKLIFSANKPPRFKDTGHAIRRRMVVIPFDYTIKEVDPRVEVRLINEIPHILSMLVKRIQENIKRNEGVFKLSRGGEAASEAQKKVLLNGNSVVEWSKERVISSLEISDEKYLVVSEAYSQYKLWCGENGYTPMNCGRFSVNMHNFVVTNVVSGDDNRRRIGGKQVRVFKRTTWRDE
jgi:P4 family phage/plasmid primase-like protien